MKKFLLCLIGVLFLSGQACAQSLRAEVNRTQVPEGETVMLILSYDGNETGTPDIGVLNDDFTIYSAGNTIKSQMINGSFSSERQWNLVLMPKRSGDITIPAIKLGAAESQPLTIKVLSAGEAYSQEQTQSGTPQPDQKPRFFIQGHVDTPNPFVQEQVNYTVTLFDAGGLQGQEPTFINADSKDWIIRSLGEPTVKSTVINGVNMREITFNYALFPQRSGKLNIPQARFDGFYLTKQKRIDPFADLFQDDFMGFGLNMHDMFATRNPVTLVTKPVEIEVKPVPAENGGNWWIPAKNVVLYSTFEPANPTFKVGEAVTRTIYVKAEGVLDNQLPELTFKNVQGLKQYPEKPEIKTTVENSTVVSIAQISNVYIPNSAGETTIPAVELNWFNIKTHQPEKATLPAIKIKVDGASAPLDNAQTSASVTEEQKAAPRQDAPAEPVVQNNSGRINTSVLVTAAFALGLIISYLLFRPTKKEDHLPEKVKDYKKFIIKQAKAGNLKELRDAIIEWCRKKYQNDRITNLTEAAKAINDPAFTAETEKLSAALYSGSASLWDSKSFLNNFERIYDYHRQQKTNNKILPELYD